MNYFGTPAERNELESRLPGSAGIERLQVLVALAWYSREADTRRAVALADEGEALLARIPELAATEGRRCEARLLLTRAATEGLLGRFQSASSLTQQARDRFDALGDASGASDSCRIESEVCFWTGHFDASDDALRAALACSEKGGDRLRAALCRSETAWFAVHRKAADAAAQVDRFLDDVRALQHPLLDAEETAIHGAADNARNAYAGSIVHYERCYELRLANGQLQNAISAANFVSVGYRNIGDDLQAPRWAERSLDLARTAGWPTFIALGLRRVASGMRSLRRFSAARDMLQEALDLLRPLGPSDGLWSTFQYLSEVACDLGDFEEALQWAREAASMEPSTALESNSGAFLLGQLAQARALSGLNRPNDAFAQARRALEMATRTSDDSWRIRTLTELAHIARAHGLAVPEGSTSANAEIHYLEAALAVGQAIDGYSVPADLWSDLSRSHEAAGDLLQALACERRASAARDSDASKKASAMATLLQVRYESERSKAQAAAARVEAEYQRSLAVAEAAANRAKSEFLANMSHELRTPLNAVLGFTRLLSRDSRLPESAREDLSIAARSGEHLYRLINQVLEVSKIEVGHVSLVPVEFGLRELLDETLEMVSEPARAKGLALRLELDAHAPRRLRADAQKLRQVLINLLANAVKFTDTGGVRMHVACESSAGAGSSAAKVDEAPGMLSIEVIDSGVGIAEDELPRLGEAFVQARAGRASGVGTGLGLAISRGFVRLLGGDLGLSSRLGAGTTARVRIPVVVCTDSPADEALPPARVSRLAPGQPTWRILAVDDRPESRRLLALLLQPLGFEVREAADGRQAVAQWREWRPQLICMDMRMPVMDGREATQRIKAEPGGPQTVIVALTASSYEEEREAILDSGCDDFLRKPFREEALLELIGRHLPVRYEYEGPA